MKDGIVRKRKRNFMDGFGGHDTALLKQSMSVNIPAATRDNAIFGRCSVTKDGSNGILRTGNDKSCKPQSKMQREKKEKEKGMARERDMEKADEKESGDREKGEEDEMVVRNTGS